MKTGVYQNLIRRLAPDVDPRWVEAWMCTKHGTLDHLPADRFRHAVVLALDAIAKAGAEQSEELAQRYGL